MDAQPLHNLPEQPNPLLGREQELKTAREQLLSDDVRLLSLTGPPGVGKTRLAMAVAESVLESFPGGVWFIDLAPLQDPALVASEIASTLGIAEVHDTTALDSLVTYFGGRRMLLFLDNFEGVLRAASWVSELLERTSGLKVLTTSRERLRLRWEWANLVSPLPLPDLDLPPDLPTLAAVPSVALFVQRAAAVKANFTLSVENAPVIAALCTRLDGLPLAIELAAAHAGVLSPVEILANMNDRFHLLGMGALDLSERHETLKAAIDLSYESLPPEERQFLCRLSIFTEGFSLAAAEMVGDSEALNLDGLASLIALVEKSLINRARGPGGETRFTLLESIRDYLRDRLRESGELDDARRRHAAYYLALAERNYSEMKGASQRSWLDLLESEHDNLRAALKWSLETGEHVTGKRIAAALWSPFWWLQGHVREGLRWLQLFQESDSKSKSRDESDLRVLEGIGMLRGWRGDYEPGKALLMEALQIAEKWENEEAIVRILYWHAWISWVNGKTAEAAWLAERMEACSQDADPWDLAHASLSLGSLQYEAGLDEAAEEAFIRALQYFEFTEEKQQGVIWAGHKLALLKYQKGEYQDANKGMLEALEAARQLNDLHVIAYCVDDAVHLAARQMADQNVATQLDLDRIVGVLGAVDHWREILSLRRSPREKSAYLQFIEHLRQRMGEGSFLRAWEEGKSFPVERVIYGATELLRALQQPQPEERQVPEGGRITVALSKREHQVLSLVAEGLTNDEIGERLFITERTVRYHVTSIFNKLGADNRAQAVAIASRLHIL